MLYSNACMLYLRLVVRIFPRVAFVQVKNLPGGYSSNELSPDSPLKELSSFPQALTMIGRNTILIKGVAARLGLRHSLARDWVPIAATLLFDPPPDPTAAAAANAAYAAGGSGGFAAGSAAAAGQTKRGKRARAAAWLAQAATALALRRSLPAPLRRRGAALLLWASERGDKR
jgi:aarF domain-containing kinase